MSQCFPGLPADRQEMENMTHTTEMPWWDELDQQLAGGISVNHNWSIRFGPVDLFCKFGLVS